MLKKLMMTTAAAAFAAGLAVSTPALADIPESEDPIIIVQNNWTSQLVLSTVVGKVLEGMGYTVEFAPSDSQLQFKAIADGDQNLIRCTKFCWCSHGDTDRNPPDDFLFRYHTRPPWVYRTG